MICWPLVYSNTCLGLLHWATSSGALTLLPQGTKFLKYVTPVIIKAILYPPPRLGKAAAGAVDVPFAVR